MTAPRRCAGAALALALAAAAAGATDPTPPAPPGYRWATCVGMGARLLMPERWHLRDSTGAESDSCSISRAPADGAGRFETGLAISRLRHVPDRSGVSASDFARRFLDQVEAKYRVRRRSSSSQPPFEAYRAEVDVDVPDGPPLRLYQLAIANPITGTVYLIVFRTPASRWEEDWPVIEPVIEQLGLDTGA